MVSASRPYSAGASSCARVARGSCCEEDANYRHDAWPRRDAEAHCARPLRQKWSWRIRDSRIERRSTDIAANTQCTRHRSGYAAARSCSWDWQAGSGKVVGRRCGSLRISGRRSEAYQSHVRRRHSGGLGDRNVFDVQMPTARWLRLLRPGMATP
jgi:hypothetical protein